MRIIGSIDDPEVIRKILKHLGLWSAKKKPPPRTNAPPVHIHLDYSDSQIPSSEDSLYKDFDFPIETCPF
jgi:predicted Zn-dependent peptidase